MEINFDVSLDLFTNEKIKLSDYFGKPFKKNKTVKSVGYNLQKAAAYYLEKYNLDFVEVLEQFFDLPKCPITNKSVGITLGGKIKFSEFASDCDLSLRAKYIADNNVSFKAHVERMKLDRRGAGNPVFGKKAWNKDISPSKKSIEKANVTRSNWSESFREQISLKQSTSAIASAKKFSNRGMGGKTHSEETKEKCRQATIRRIKEGKFPQTETYINKIFEQLLINHNLPYEKEFSFGHFVFDFKVKNYLIEIQGDYWHCNPNLDRFKDGYKKNKRLQNNYGRDIAKKMEVEKSEYNFLQFWEFDLNNNIKDIELCLKELLM